MNQETTLVLVYITKLQYSSLPPSLLTSTFKLYTIVGMISCLKWLFGL